MKGDKIQLRALEPEDLTFLYNIENDVKNWIVSETKIPFSKYLLKTYLDQAGLGIEKTGQFRFVIEETESMDSVGLIDVFDFDPINRRISLGVLVNEDYRNKGYAFEALSLIENYAAEQLNVHQIYCEVQADNIKSIDLFSKNNYRISGTKKDWILKRDTFTDVLFFQKFL